MVEQFSIDKKKFPHIALVVVVSLLLSGCAGNIPFMGKEPKEQGEKAFMTETLGLEADFSYERKPEKPHIQVDRLGYLPKSAKVGIVQGEELPESFQVLEKDSGKCVYEGKVRRKEEVSDGTLTGYCIFTDLEEEGNYYIECDTIGCSYYFFIGKDVYEEKEKELGKVIEEMYGGGIGTGGQETGEGVEYRTEDVCETMSYLLATYEMYPGLLLEIWGDERADSNSPEEEAEDFFKMLRRETDWLLSLQDEKTGGIYENAGAALVVSGDVPGEQEISEDATAAFAGTMAKYSYLYQQYDLDYANICLKAAAKAWRYLNDIQGLGASEGRRDIDADEGSAYRAGNPVTGRFYAASELYRASNEVLYHNYILQNQELILGQDEDFYLLMGKITYLSTRRKVEQELCGQIMDGLMKEAERITERTKEGQFLTDGEEADAILWNMTVMALANYAIMNHEYVTVLENNMHYLLGRNAVSEFLPENLESRDAAAILLLLGVIEAEREIIEDSEIKENE